jgi:hypothetical protein
MTIVVQPHTAHSRHARATNCKRWRRPSAALHPVQQNARRCRPRVIRLDAATSEFLVCRLHETASRLHVTSTRREWVRHVADTCHMQQASRARGVRCTYMHDHLGYEMRLATCKDKVGDESSSFNERQGERETGHGVGAGHMEYHGRRSASSRPALHRGGKGRAANACRLESCAVQRCAVQCHRSDQGTSDSMGLHLPFFKKRSASLLPTGSFSITVLPLLLSNLSGPNSLLVIPLTLPSPCYIVPQPPSRLARSLPSRPSPSSSRSTRRAAASSSPADHIIHTIYTIHTIHSSLRNRHHAPLVQHQQHELV